jgi:hypothetical protein
LGQVAKPTHINSHPIVDITFPIANMSFLDAQLPAAAMAVADAVAKFRTRPSTGGGQKGFAPAGIGDILAALRDLLIALGNLPVWFAVFLAGGALIWFARDTIALCH